MAVSSALIGRYVFSCYLCFYIMFYNVSVWVSYDEYNVDDWSTGPDDDFVPAEYNSVSHWFVDYNNVSWSDVMNIHASWALTPGDHNIDVVAAS